MISRHDNANIPPMAPRRRGRSCATATLTQPEKESPTMRTNPVRFLSISTLVAVLLINPYCLSLVAVVHAGTPDKPSQVQRVDKVSPLLKGNNRTADERITVIVGLVGPRSGLLNAFLNENNIHLRREMKSLNSFSLSLPYSMIVKLASFPEVVHVSSNRSEERR